MTTHIEARNNAHTALVAKFGEPITPGEIKALAGVACLETSYGDGWKGAGKGSFNMGAIQGTGPAGSFVYTDTHPNAGGTNTPYQIAFRRYRSVVEGWADLVNVVYVNRGRARVREAAKAGDWYGVSKALHETGYYEGYGRTEAERVANHHRALSRAIAAADGAALPAIGVPTLPPTIRHGSTGEAVKLLQRELAEVATGVFDEDLDAHVRYYQDYHGLIADGIVGPTTWRTLFGDDFSPAEDA